MSAGAAGVQKAVVYAVFYNGLNNKFRDLHLHQKGIQIKFVVEDIAEADLLRGEVGIHIGDLLLDRNIIRFVFCAGA